MKRHELRKKIPRGGIKEIANEAGVSVVSVSRFFRGDFNSNKIEFAALKIANKYNAQRKVLEKGLR